MKGPSELDIRKRLTAEEEADQLNSTAVEALVESSNDYTETKYLLYELDLEEQQYVFNGFFRTAWANPA